jgi:serine-type D-Ala-D-Ala carboxypeptidase/endopeptidase (penicillin-binding protein 4)
MRATISSVSISFALAVMCLFSAFSLPAQTTRPRVLPSQTPPNTPSPQVPSASPAATTTPTPLPAPQRVQTLEELQAKIRQRLFTPEVRRGRMGVKVISLATGKVVYEQDSEKYFMPASNMKNFTVAAALERLGPEFRFVTSVFANSAPDPNGTLVGDIRVFGRGDVSISTAFFGTSAADPETYYKGIDRLVDRILAAGIKRIDGGIVADESYFKGFHIPQTWEWDDLQWSYGAEVSALPINDNAVDVAVLPGTPGSPCRVIVSPPNALLQVVNLCTTAGTRSLRVTKQIDRNVLEIAGTLAQGDSGWRNSISITRPAELFAHILKQRLEAKGVTISGAVRMAPTNVAPPQGQVEIARLESVPLSVIAAKTMKPSQNMYTETLLWTLGEEIGRKSGRQGSSADLGLDVLRTFLAQAGIPADGILPYDGSGLSRHNLVTPAAVASLYVYMANQSRNATAWTESLTIGGIDGTLANRFRGTAAAANVRGKTGTIDQVSALSGYVTTAGGERLVFSLLVNGVVETRARTSLIDAIVVDLASFNGRVDAPPPLQP